MHHWGKVMNDELAAIAGKYEDRVGRLQEKYGIAKEEAKRRVDEFKKNRRAIEKINVGLELTPFFSIGKKARLLFDAQVSFSI